MWTAILKLIPLDAILKSVNLEELLTAILTRLRGISTAQWKAALQYVMEATGTNEEKYKWVYTALTERFIGLSESATKWLIETALTFLKVKGLLPSSAKTLNNTPGAFKDS